MSRFIRVVMSIGLVLVSVGCTQQTEQAGNGGKEALNGAGDVMSGAGDTVKEAAQSAGDATQQAVDSAQEATSDLADSAQEATSELAGKASDALGEGFSAVTEKASAALANVEGGKELLDKVSGLFTSAGSTIQGITDPESARAALPKLNELDGSIEGLSESIDKLPEGAKSAITSVLENGSAGLKDLIDKVLAIPGVAEIVKPKLDELMAKISALSGKQQ